MNNSSNSINYIHIGESAINWRFQKLACTVTCAKAEPLNSFDKVICGLLSLDECLSLEQLGNLMGFNVIDNPDAHVYKDSSEYSILAAAISNLEQYELISSQVLPFEAITRYSLTEKGRIALSTGKKLSYETPQIDVIIDNLCNNKESYIFLSKLSATPCDDSSDINVENLKELVSVQHPDIADHTKGKTVDNVYVNESTSFEIVMPLSIHYDYKSKQYFIDCNSLPNAELISNIINQQTDLKDAILSKFFEGFEESIIFKPKFQQVLEEEGVNGLYLESRKRILGIQDFYNYLDEEIPSDASEVYFFLPYMDEKAHKTMVSFAQHHRNQIICVEFPNGDKRFFDYANDNLIYRKANKLRTDSLCVCDTNVFYNTVDFVIDYKGKSYNFNIVSKESGIRYRTDIIKSSTLNRAIESISENLCTKIDDIIAKPTRKSILNIVSRGKGLYTYSGGKCQNNEKYNLFSDKVKIVIQQWREQLLSEIENIRVASLTKSNRYQISAKLADIENQCKDLAEDLIPQINELKKKLTDSLTRDPQIIKQYGFVLDTSVYMEDPYILQRIDRVKFAIILPQPVKDELDDIDHRNDEVKRQKAHVALNIINNLLRDQLPFLIWEKEADLSLLPNGFDYGKKDNHIMCAALKYEQNQRFKAVGIVIKDGNFETDAWGIGLTTYSIDQFFDFIDENRTEVSIPLDQEMPDELKRILVNGYNNCLLQSKEVLMSMLVSAIKKENPDFSTALYGFPKFKKLCEAYPSIIKVYTNRSNALCIKMIAENDISDSNKDGSTK